MQRDPVADWPLTPKSVSSEPGVQEGLTTPATPGNSPEWIRTDPSSYFGRLFLSIFHLVSRRTVASDHSQLSCLPIQRKSKFNNHSHHWSLLSPRCPPPVRLETLPRSKARNQALRIHGDWKDLTHSEGMGPARADHTAMSCTSSALLLFLHPDQ